MTMNAVKVFKDKENSLFLGRLTTDQGLPDPCVLDSTRHRFWKVLLKFMCQPLSPQSLNVG